MWVFLQVDERYVAGDGFMLNLLSVLQQLSVKISLDKVSQVLHYKNQCNCCYFCLRHVIIGNCWLVILFRLTHTTHSIQILEWALSQRHA